MNGPTSRGCAIVAIGARPPSKRLEDRGEPMPTTNVILRWHPQRFNSALLGAFRSSVGDAKIAALLRSPSPTKAGARYTLRGPTSATLRTTGKLGHIFEGGREGGYIIQPGLRTVRGRAEGGSRFQKVTKGVRAGSGNIALKFSKGDGGFARGAVVGGAMRAKPYIHPAASLWSHQLYQRRAAAAIRTFALGR